MARYVFALTFVLAFIFQLALWKVPYMSDVFMWSNQALYVDTGNPEQFNFDLAYAHPGGPLIIGTILAHKFFNAPYSINLFLVVLSFLNSLIIAFISLFCFLLKRESLWWLFVFILVSLHQIYFFATPPSALASLLFMLFSLVTFFIIKNKEHLSAGVVFCWSLVCGFLVATRADIGLLTSFVFFFVLLRFIGFQKTFFASVGAIFFFILLDPFMWSMPVQHLGDLWYKVTYHYADYPITKMSWFYVLQISALSLVSIFIFIFTFLNKKIKKSLPAFFGFCLLFLTFILYLVFLTSNFQAPRYFMPTILLWESFLFLFLIDLIPLFKFESIKRDERRIFLSKFIFFTIIFILLFSQMRIFISTLALYL